MNKRLLTFADEALLGDGLLAYVTALGLLEGLQLEGVCVDALQLVGLRGREEGREIRGRVGRTGASSDLFVSVDDFSVCEAMFPSTAAINTCSLVGPECF